MILRLSSYQLTDATAVHHIHEISYPEFSWKDSGFGVLKQRQSTPDKIAAKTSPHKRRILHVSLDELHKAMLSNIELRCPGFDWQCTSTWNSWNSMENTRFRFRIGRLPTLLFWLGLFQLSLFPQLKKHLKRTKFYSNSKVSAALEDFWVHFYRAWKDNKGPLK